MIGKTPPNKCDDLGSIIITIYIGKNDYSKPISWPKFHNKCHDKIGTIIYWTY